MKNLDKIIEHVEKVGLKAYEPFIGDTMGDKWSRLTTQAIKDSMKKAGLPELGPGIGIVYNIMQWLCCEICGMRHRIISSPQGMAICGWFDDAEKAGFDFVEATIKTIDAMNAE